MKGEIANGFPSQSHDQEHPSLLPVTSLEKIESSVSKLLRNWNRRRRWRLLFNNHAATGEYQTQDPSCNAAPWRSTLARFLESNPVHIVTIVLLVSDVVLTILELSSSILSQCTRRGERPEDLWFHWAGISILCLLLVKSVGLIVGLGASFFTRPSYVVDGVVLVGAIFLETLLDGEGGGLLVVVILWRVLRLVESAFELSDDAIEAQIKDIELQLESLKENRRLMETS